MTAQPSQRSSSFRLTMAGILGVLVLGACTTTATPRAGAPVSAQGSAATSDKAASTQIAESTASGTSSGGDVTSPVASGSSDDNSPADGSSTTTSERGLTPIEFPYEIEVPALAWTTPTCVARGGSVTLEVRTKPGAAIGYQAVYQGNQSGADAPFGKGYGGNDKGEAAASGEWQNTWVVALNAPLGKARVDVVIGWEGKWGYEKPFFTVARSPEACG